MKYRIKSDIIEATVWNKNGDHPLDDVMRPFENGTMPNVAREGAVVRYYRRPGVDGNKVCSVCKKSMNEHGWIDTEDSGMIVCPGDYVSTNRDGGFYSCRAEPFEANYEPVVE